MKYHKTIAAIVMLFFVTGLLTLPGRVEASQYLGTWTINCTQVVGSGTGAHILDRNNTGTGQELINVRATDGAGTVLVDFTYSNTLGTFGGGVGAFNYTTPPQYNPITVTLTSLAGNGLPAQVDSVATGACASLPTYEPVAVAGCDALLPIPASAVGGTFTSFARLYYAPGNPVEPELSLAPGKTARVTGVDASGEYAQIIWGCNFLWVPRGTIGPNYDAVWNGAPLPTGVID